MHNTTHSTSAYLTRLHPIHHHLYKEVSEKGVCGKRMKNKKVHMICPKSHTQIINLPSISYILLTVDSLRCCIVGDGVFFVLTGQVMRFPDGDDGGEEGTTAHQWYSMNRTLVRPRSFPLPPQEGKFPYLN